MWIFWNIHWELLVLRVIWQKMVWLGLSSKNLNFEKSGFFNKWKMWIFWKKTSDNFGTPLHWIRTVFTGNYRKISRKHARHPSYTLDFPAILGNEYDWCDFKSVPNRFFIFFDMYFRVFLTLANIFEQQLWVIQTILTFFRFFVKLAALFPILISLSSKY